MTTRITLDPVTRLEGHLSVKVQVENGQVIEAYSSGTLYRGFENILLGRDPRDAMHVTQRICGVCPTSQGLAAAQAVEAACGLTVPNNARLIRNLVMAADFLHSHIFHFYQLSLLDYVDGPDMPPWTPHYSAPSRFNTSQITNLIDHYRQAFTARRQAHEMGAVFAGKLPHTPAFEPGGVTVNPNAQLIQTIRNLLAGVRNFIEQVYLPDVQLLADTYPEYFDIGRGYGHLLAFGAYELDNSGQNKLFRRGLALNGGQPQAVDLSQVAEEVAYAWYEGAAPPSGEVGPYRTFLPFVTTSSQATPGNVQPQTTPTPDKVGAYSWLKAPRYGGQACEVGPLARQWINGDYQRGISVMDRHLARAQEARQLAMAMGDWLNQLQPGQAVFSQPHIPVTGAGIGLTEAARGALGHWTQIINSKLSGYQIITPTCWNCSPRDDQSVPGPLEQALLGVSVADSAQPVEVLRIVHSFDPCLACAVH